MKEFDLPSGAKLRVGLAPFADGDALLKTLFAEGNFISFNGATDEFQIVKEVLCRGSSSPLILQAIKKCMEQALYEGQKITDKTFEPEDARQDYLEVLYLVGEVNIYPFTKSLSALLKRISAKVISNRA